jgi:hypothetical protein
MPQGGGQLAADGVARLAPQGDSPVQADTAGDDLLGRHKVANFDAMSLTSTCCGEARRREAGRAVSASATHTRTAEGGGGVAARTHRPRA